MTDLEALNREVAEKVMGWTVKDYDGELIAYTGGTRKAIVLHPKQWTGSGWSKQCELWSPATDIAAAFEVVEKILADKPTWRFKLQSRPGMWLACFSHWVADESLKCEATGTKPEAICRAALQVVGAETR